MNYKFVTTSISKAVFDEAVVKRRSLLFTMHNGELGQVSFSILAIGAVNRCGNAAADPFMK